MGEGWQEGLRLDARQQLVLEALTEAHRELGSVYAGIIRVLNDELNPGAAYQAAHLARDLCDRLHEYLGVAYDGAREGKHRATKALILGLDPEDPLVRHFYEVGQKLKRHAHLRGPEQDPPDREQLASDVGELEDVLLALLGPFYEVFPDIDELLSVGTPSEDDVRKLEAVLVRRSKERRAYFFSNLDKPGWLGALWRAGFFSNAPDPTINEAAGTIAFPVWPESRYLARTASHDPKTVHEIIDDILSRPSGVENARVLEDVLDAALAMPTGLAADIARRAEKWKRPYYFLVPEKMAQLMRKLAREGRTGEAMGLARSLLAVRSDDTRARAAEEKGLAFPIGPEAQSYLSEHEYRRILQESFPSVVSAAADEAVKLLCDLLQKAIEIEQSEADAMDYSYIWRPAVEDHEQNTRFRLKEDLVEAIRDAAIEIIGSCPDVAKPVLDELEARPFAIFRRIALYLLSWRPEVDRRRVAARLGDRGLFEDGHLRHEYYLLAQACFQDLQPEQQQEILSWVKAGPDLEGYEENYAKWHGQKPSAQDLDRFRKVWTVERLAFFASMLPPEWQQKWDELVAEVAEPEHPELTSYHEVRVGVPTPKPAEELSRLPTAQLVEFLRDWEPSEQDRWGPAPEGLGQALQAAVEAESDRYAREAGQFRGLRATYVRHILGGLAKVSRADGRFCWEPVLDLCKWVVEEAEPEPPEAPWSADQADPRWQSARKTIADLMVEGLRRDQTPFGLREVVWGIIESLTNDPNPTPEDEERYSEGPMGPAGTAINTVRGEAMHGVVHYALWCARHLRPDDPVLQREPPFWEEIPEVEEVLDYHLDPDKDRSAAVRSVYGEHLPGLVLLSPTWVRSNLSRIFPQQAQWRHLRDAAWGAYLIFSGPYRNVVDIIRDEYGRAVEELGEEGADMWRPGDTQRRLAEHLMGLYWSGYLQLHDPLLARFYEKGSASVRGAAISFVGRSLHQMDGTIPPDEAERLRKLVQSRMAAAEQNEDEMAIEKELASFGWWFASGQLGEEASLQILVRVLQLTNGRTEPDHLVAERLAILAPGRPLLAVQCLAKMVDADSEGWRIFGLRQHAREMLRLALTSSVEEAEDLARRLTNELGERGCHEFRELLRN